MIDVEIPFAVADGIQTWRNVFHNRKNGVDVRELLRLAAADLWETLETNKTVHPHAQGAAHIEIVDALHDLADGAGILPDDAQWIFAESFKARTNGAHNEAKTSDDKKINGGGDTKLEPLPFIDMSKWDGEPVPLRQWAVQDRIPLRQPALFSGEGAIGKTLLALQLSAAHVLGRDWLGMLPAPGPSIYFGAEDDTDELHRRVADIAAHYGTTFAELRAGGLHLLSFAGKGAILGAANRNGIIEPTPLFYRVHKAACEIQPKTLVLDTSADVYAGNENDRMQVRQFVGLLRRLAMDGNCAVLLCSHPSLTGISTGTGLSGSTGWHNSVRARIFFKPATTDQGDEPDPELRELVFMKNNYGPIATSVMLRWRKGVFVCEPGEGLIEKAAAERKAEELFLTLLNRFSTQGRNVSDKVGPSYAPALFAKEAEAKTAKIRKEALAEAMSRLFTANKLHMEPYGYPSRGTLRIAAGQKP
jgi:RecA-family ATPase